MLSFIVRRLGASILVLLVASFVIYTLTAVSGDPLEDLRGSTSPNKQTLIDARIRELNLDVPPPLRYFLWLFGVIKVFIGQYTLGNSISGQSVIGLVNSSVGNTLQLVSAATVLAIVLGVAIGMSTALRQYSGFDYTVTFFSFLFFSLPAFWVAVLLKLYVAIGFNNFLVDPAIGPLAIVLLALASGFLWMNIVGGEGKPRLIIFAGAAVITAAVLIYVRVTDWFTTPQLGPVWILLLGGLTALMVTTLTTGLSNRRALYSAFLVVVIGTALWYPLQFAFEALPTLWFLFALVVAAVLLGALTGYLFGLNDKSAAARTAAITALVVIVLIIVDRVMAAWPAYVGAVGGRPIATVGSQTPDLGGSMWVGLVDNFTHLLLPTMSLILISLAGYTRYARASLLEVMNQDYVRTARAKGLSERTVVMRHAFRNAMIPVVTIVAYDVGGLIGGAVITETIFAWKGMGALFTQALHTVDVNTVMGVFLVVGTVTIIFNILADLAYTALDPRIRVS